MLNHRYTKKGELRVYDGRRRATHDQKKDYFKKHFDTIPQTKLSNDDKKLFGAVKGGVMRHKNAMRFHGQFITKEMQQRIKKQLVIDLDAERIKANKTTYDELFRDNPEFLEAFEKVVTDAGLRTFFNTNTYEKHLTDKNGKYFVNGKETSFENTVHQIDQVFSVARRKMKFTKKFDGAIPIVTKNLHDYFVNLPSIEALNACETEEDVTELLDEFELKLYGS